MGDRLSRLSYDIVVVQKKLQILQEMIKNTNATIETNSAKESAYNCLGTAIQELTIAVELLHDIQIYRM